MVGSTGTNSNFGRAFPSVDPRRRCLPAQSLLAFLVVLRIEMHEKLQKKVDPTGPEYECPDLCVI